MKCKRSIWILIALASTGAAEPPSSLQAPPLWSGSGGWQFDLAGMQVTEGVRQTGDLIVEESVRLSRTGIVKETIRMKNARGADLIIPEGAKAFAISLRPATNDAPSAPTNLPVDWCVLLPAAAEFVCISWENEQQARYRQSFEKTGLPFAPVAGVPGVVPKIEEQPVDLGLQLKLQRRLVELTPGTFTVEEGISDGTRYESLARRVFNRMSNEIFVRELGGRAVAVRPAPDHKTVNVRFTAPGEKQKGPINEYPVVLDILVGVDGRAKDARLVKSSGLPNLDAKVLEEVKKSWRLEPGTENGKPVEKWGRFSVKFQWSE